MSAKAFISLMAVLAVVGLLGFGLLSKGGQTITVGDPVPDKSLAVLGGEGEGRIADYRGKWVLVNFWASWCGPCRDEAPALERFHAEHRDRGVVVLGINLDDNTDDARAFIAKYGLTYPQLRDGDGEDRRDAFGMTGFPESFLVDPDGKLGLIRRGPVDESFIAAAIEPLVES